MKYFDLVINCGKNTNYVICLPEFRKFNKKKQPKNKGCFYVVCYEKIVLLVY